MRAVLKLEFIAENYFAYKRHGKREEEHWQITLKTPISGGTERYGDYLGRDQSRPWVARLLGLSSVYQFEREFMRGQIDYSHANMVGSRGVYIYYPLKDGLYEVNARETWKRTRRYFLRVEGETMTEIEREEVIQCLENAKSQI